MKKPHLSLRFLVKLVLTAVILAVILNQIEWSRFWESIRSVRMIWLLALAASAAADRMWMAAKWWYLLRGMDVRVPYSHTLRHYLVGGLVGLAVQWQLGGDITRAVGLGQSVGKKKVIFASVFVEKVTGAAANGLLATAGLIGLLGGAPPSSARPVLAAGLVFTAAAALSPLLLVAGPLLVPLRVLARSVLQRLPSAQRLASNLDLPPLPASVWLRFYVLTLGEQLVPIINMIFLNQAFQAGLDLLPILLIMPIIGFFSRLPVSLESVGVKEGLYIYLFGLFGVAAAESFAMSLTARVLDILVMSVGAAVLLAMRGTPPDPLLQADQPPTGES